MTNKNNDNVFLNSLRGVKPIKKSNKIIKSLPKPQPLDNKKIVLKNRKTEKISEKTKDTLSFQELNIEKSNINKKLKKGQIVINKKIDFHGYSLYEAKQLFLDTIKDCYIKNHRCILFVTGKGTNKRMMENTYDNRLYFGKIRNNFLSWTSIKDVKSKILNVQQANIKKGGDGAFFVYLRKNKN